MTKESRRVHTDVGCIPAGSGPVPKDPSILVYQKQYGVTAGLKIFGEDGYDAPASEIRNSLHGRGVIDPVRCNKVTHDIRKASLPYLMFLKRKRCGKTKGRGCVDGRKQQEFISREEASSPTISTHALMATCLIDVIEDRDVATADIPGAFLQAMMDDDVYIKFEGKMVEVLLGLYSAKIRSMCVHIQGTTLYLCQGDQSDIRDTTCHTFFSTSSSLAN